MGISFRHLWDPSKIKFQTWSQSVALFLAWARWGWSHFQQNQFQASNWGLKASSLNSPFYIVKCCFHGNTFTGLPVDLIWKETRRLIFHAISFVKPQIVPEWFYTGCIIFVWNVQYMFFVYLMNFSISGTIHQNSPFKIYKSVDHKAAPPAAMRFSYNLLSIIYYSLLNCFGAFLVTSF